MGAQPAYSNSNATVVPHSILSGMVTLLLVTFGEARCEDSSRLVREKTRTRQLQSSRFHHLCRLISGSEELDERPHALFLTAAEATMRTGFA